MEHWGSRRMGLDASLQPTLKIPNEKRGNGPRFIVQEDVHPGQYQLRRTGDGASTSAVSLADWTPVAELPGRMVDNQFPPSPASDGSQWSTLTTPKPRKRLLRLAAWVKRSGKGIVLRMRRQRPGRAIYEVTDMHLLPPELCGEDKLMESFYTHTDLSSPPIYCHTGALASELAESRSVKEMPSPTSWISELGGAQLGVPELDISPLRVMRPQTDHTDADTARTSAARIGIDMPGDACSATLPLNSAASAYSFDAWADDDQLHSPAATVSTDLSTADTAVSWDNASPAGQPNNAVIESQPIASALRVSRSVRYKYKPVSKPTAFSPTELMRLAEDYQALVPEKLTMGRHEAVSNALDPPEPLPTDPLKLAAPPMKKSEASQNASLVTPATHGELLISGGGQQLPVHAFHGMTTSTLLFQQDLQVDKALVQRLALISQSLVPPYQLNIDMTALLRGTKIAKKATEIRSDVCTSALTSKTSDTSSEILPTSNKIALDVNELQEHAESRLVKDGTAANEQKTSDSSGMRDTKPSWSPVSPLSQREIKRSGSLVSALVPITPLSPDRMVDHVHTPRTGEAQAAPIDTSPAPSTPPSRDEVELLKEEKSAITAAANDQTAVVELPKEQTKLESEPGAADFGVKHLADLLEYQHSPAPPEEQPVPPLGYLSDDKMPAKYKNTRFGDHLRIDTNVVEQLPPQVVLADDSWEDSTTTRLGRRSHPARPTQSGILRDTTADTISGLAEGVRRCASWLERHAGREPAILEDHVRVRWTCNCGEHLFDDFKELRPGAAADLEAVLNKERPASHHGTPSSSRGSQSGQTRTPGSSGHPSSSATTWSSHSDRYGPPTGFPRRSGSRTIDMSYQWLTPPAPRYLLTLHQRG
jgi:hypothetical protein